MMGTVRSLMLLAIFVLAAGGLFGYQPPKDPSPSGPPPEPPKGDLPKLTPPPGSPGQPDAGKAPMPKATTNQPATILVHVPANATIHIGEQKMTQTGPRRSFQSPALEPGKTYYYTLKVSWPTQAGQPDYASQHEVTVRAGQTTEIDFRGVAGTGIMTPQPGTIYSPSRPSIFRSRPEGSGIR